MVVLIWLNANISVLFIVFFFHIWFKLIKHPLPFESHEWLRKKWLTLWRNLRKQILHELVHGCGGPVLWLWGRNMHLQLIGCFFKAAVYASLVFELAVLVIFLCVHLWNNFSYIAFPLFLLVEEPELAFFQSSPPTFPRKLTGECI